MDKLKKMLLGLLTVSLALLLVFQLYEALTLDSTAPVITCPAELLEVSVSSTDQELLSGVSAQDDQDGDLTANVVVEGLSAMGRDGTRQVTYAVMDLSGNVGRAVRTLRYTDYQTPRIQLFHPLRAASRSQAEQLLTSIRASSVLDGDLTTKFKYNFLTNTPVVSDGSYPIELRVNDSAGNSMVIPTELVLYNPREESIQVELSQYILYLHTGDPFEPEAFFKTSSEAGALSIQSSVDVSVPGVYHADYTVTNHQTNDLGKSRLVVVVEA